MALTEKSNHLVYGTVIFICLLPFISPAIALLIGLCLSLLGIRHENFSRYKSFVLQASIVLMGFGMNVTQVINASKTGFLVTAVSVTVTLTLGLLLGKMLKVERNTSMLIASGTAICGGSAIAAIAPVLRAKDAEISFSLIVIFVLNAVALFIFPVIGHYFNLSQETFGLWSAIAIHDTSSVVGAGAIYGAKALEVGTIVKLTRTLWIIPLALGIAFFNNKNEKTGKFNPPWFIGLFVLAIISVQFLPAWTATFEHLYWLGRKGMVIALFLIGSNLSVQEVKKAGARSFILGITLWLIVASSSLFLFTEIV